MKRYSFALLAVLAALSLHASAQSYPTKAVHVVISFTPGSSTDIVGRIVTQKLTEMWGQPVVPENRAGAGGSIGSAAVAKAAPDGYTLLINSNAHSVNPAIYAKLPYDTLKDFTEITPLAIQPNVFVVTTESPYKTLAEFINAAKAKPGTLNIGHAGIGSGTHLTTEKFIAATSIKVTEVPFKGTPEVMAAMLSGDVQAYWAPISAGMSLIKGGKLRPLAVSTAKRNPQLPDVPTPAEAGAKGAESPLWFGLWGPAGMSAELVTKIHTHVRPAVADPAVKDRLGARGHHTIGKSAQEISGLVRRQVGHH